MRAGSRLNGLDGEHWLAREIDGENAPPVREIARINPATVCFNTPSAAGKNKTDARSIGAALLERPKELVSTPTWEAAALVLDLDDHTFGAGPDPENDGGAWPGELERILQEGSEACYEHLSVSFYRHVVFDRHYRQSDSTGVRFHFRGRTDFIDEARNQELLPILHAV